MMASSSLIPTDQRLARGSDPPTAAQMAHRWAGLKAPMSAAYLAHRWALHWVCSMVPPLVLPWDLVTALDLDWSMETSWDCSKVHRWVPNLASGKGLMKAAYWDLSLALSKDLA